MSNSGTITITARTLDLAREALAEAMADHPYRVLDRVAVTGTIIPHTPPRLPHDWRAPPASRCKRRQGLLGSR